MNATKLGVLVEQILDPTTDPNERADIYKALGAEFGASVEPLLWVLARNETIETARVAAYAAIDVTHARDRAALLAAARREAAQRSPWSFSLIRGLIEHPTDEVREFLRDLFRPAHDENEAWRVEVLRQVYGTMKGDGLVEARITAYLADHDDRIRSWAVLASSEAGNAEMVPMAVALLDSKDPRARMIGVAVLQRHGTEAQFRSVLARDWSRDKELKIAIEAAMNARGFVPPQNP
jgi:hypothetical protein